MIQLIGDLALTGLYVDDPKNNPKRIEQILPFFKEDCICLANLETPIFVLNSQNPEKNKIHTTNEHALADVLLPLGIQGVSLANNHIYDCTLPGIKATIAALKKLGIQFTGAGYKPEHLAPVFFENKGKKIAFLAYVDRATNPKTEAFDDLYINYFDLEKVKQDIEEAKSQADIIVCSVHWGVDYSFYPTALQRKQAQNLIDCGVSIVMGHHPHTIQPYEKYKDGLIFYSLGGLTFGDYIKKNNQYGALFKKTKTGVVVSISEKGDPSFQTTFEKIGNYVVPGKMNFLRWSRSKWRMFQLSEKYPVVLRWRKFKERVLDRVYEYFFGYYQNPLRRLFQLKNLAKIKRL